MTTPGMPSIRAIPLALLGCALLGCGSAPDPLDPTDAAGGGGGGGASDGGTSDLDTTAAGLTAFVKEGRYKDWRAEPALHASTGPHGGKVRTFFNATLVSSLEANKDPHPVGSVMVKELWGSGTAITGHAVGVKVTEGAAADTWLWYEGFVSSDYKNPFYGKGLSLCAGCHEQGADYVISALP